MVEQPIAQPTQPLTAPGDPERLPLRLARPDPGDDLAHALGAVDRQSRDQRVIGGVDYLEALGRRRSVARGRLARACTAAGFGGHLAPLVAVVATDSSAAGRLARRPCIGPDVPLFAPPASTRTLAICTGRCARRSWCAAAANSAGGRRRLLRREVVSGGRRGLPSPEAIDGTGERGRVELAAAPLPEGAQLRHPQPQ